ncbi:unnamed protein product [Nippostrongylus brasiliensis]|uniref:SET domain-containing protein n=1 Tax=Nippostrongylus brasiliensis TaxID=27835 RepID=A0A158QXB5_NIPBR|nr:unnamed protein product [Nippostrongylus brasiliensis]
MTDFQVWRHGDRTPLKPYPTDPYLSYWRQWPQGELTTIGMQQHYTQGVKLRQRYCDTYGLVNKTFTREEVGGSISIISSSTPRCIQSAAANFAGFYAESTSTYPQGSSWPTGWTPVPIVTRPDNMDHAIETNKDCPRQDELFAARSANEEFVKWWAEHAPTILTITENSGENITDFSALGDLYDVLKIEKEYRGWTMPSWVTNHFYNSLKDLTERTGDFEFGNGDFGEGDQEEMIMLRGGQLLKEMLTNFQTAGNANSPKYYVYSALAYSADADSDFRVVTNMIDGCPASDGCPYDVFRSRCRKFLPKDIVVCHCSSCMVPPKHEEDPADITKRIEALRTLFQAFHKKERQEMQQEEQNREEIASKKRPSRKDDFLEKTVFEDVDVKKRPASAVSRRRKSKSSVRWKSQVKPGKQEEKPKKAEQMDLVMAEIKTSGFMEHILDSNDTEVVRKLFESGLVQPSPNDVKLLHKAFDKLWEELISSPTKYNFDQEMVVFICEREKSVPSPWTKHMKHVIDDEAGHDRHEPESGVRSATPTPSAAVVALDEEDEEAKASEAKKRKRKKKSQKDRRETAKADPEAEHGRDQQKHELSPEKQTKVVEGKEEGKKRKMALRTKTIGDYDNVEFSMEEFVVDADKEKEIAEKWQATAKAPEAVIEMLCRGAKELKERKWDDKNIHERESDDNLEKTQEDGLIAKLPSKGSDRQREAKARDHQAMRKDSDDEHNPPHMKPLVRTTVKEGEREGMEPKGSKRAMSSLRDQEKQSEPKEERHLAVERRKDVRKEPPDRKEWSDLVRVHKKEEASPNQTQKDAHDRKVAEKEDIKTKAGKVEKELKGQSSGSREHVEHEKDKKESLKMAHKEKVDAELTKARYELPAKPPEDKRSPDSVGKTEELSRARMDDTKQSRQSREKQFIPEEAVPIGQQDGVPLGDISVRREFVMDPPPAENVVTTPTKLSECFENNEMDLLRASSWHCSRDIRNYEYGEVNGVPQWIKNKIPEGPASGLQLAYFSRQERLNQDPQFV